MVCIGFLEEYNYQEILQYLKEQQITFIQDIGVMNNYQYIEIETQALSEKGLCCWGEYNEAYYNLSKDDYIPTDENSNNGIYEQIQRIIVRNKRLLKEDGDFWIALAQKFVLKYGSIAYYRYYEDMNTPATVVYVELNALTYDNLLNIEPNQILMIHS